MSKAKYLELYLRREGEQYMLRVTLPEGATYRETEIQRDTEGMPVSLTFRDHSVLEARMQSLRSMRILERQILGLYKGRIQWSAEGIDNWDAHVIRRLAEERNRELESDTDWRIRCLKNNIETAKRMKKINSADSSLRREIRSRDRLTERMRRLGYSDAEIEERIGRELLEVRAEDKP